MNISEDIVDGKVCQECLAPFRVPKGCPTICSCCSEAYDAEDSILCDGEDDDD